MSKNSSLAAGNCGSREAADANGHFRAVLTKDTTPNENGDVTPNRVDLHRLIEGLRSIPDEAFDCQPVWQYLGENPIDPAAVEKYCFWDPAHYTRNLVYKDERFEMLAICWQAGQESRIHDHSGQKCWMTVPIGNLKGQNFAVESMDEAGGLCKLRPTDSFELADCLSAAVDLDAPIHQIQNSAGERAVSIHIYSKPFETCRSYCRDTDTFKEVHLAYTSIDGKLVAR